MAKIPQSKLTTPLPGVPHFAKLPTAPKPRMDQRNIRVAPIDRLVVKEQPEKPDVDLS